MKYLIRHLPVFCGTLLIALILPFVADAQPLGTFRWQLQPFCNVVTLAVTQSGGVYRLEGTDDQCGSGAGQASAIGTAFPNPDGTIGLGLNIVAAPGGAPVHVDAAVNLSTLSGTWRDSAGNSGTFALTPGAGNGGGPRPASTLVVPAAIQLRPDGGVVAGGARSVGEVPASGPGVRMMWYPGKAAMRAGEVSGNSWDEAFVGLHGTAFGVNTRASGIASMAIGDSAIASGRGSAAFGISTTASNVGSAAIGEGSVASGIQSTAMGSSVANGRGSTAMGFESLANLDGATAMGQSARATGIGSLAAGVSTTASGTASTALGNASAAGGHSSVALGFNAQLTAGAEGAFAFSDRSSGQPFIGTLPNQFLVRAAGGVRFYSNAALTAGVFLAPGSSAWSVASDINRKTLFRDIEGDTVLDKLARLSIQEWSYKAQDASIRHVGPTAQEFHAAFGLGEDPLRISTIDADGIALRAVQALEVRDRTASAAHGSEIDALQHALRDQADEIAALREVVSDLMRQLAAAPNQLKGK